MKPSTPDSAAMLRYPYSGHRAGGDAQSAQTALYRPGGGMTELGIARIGPRVERHNYTTMHVGAAEQWAESGLHGAMVGAIEIAASHYARAFAVASVHPSIPALSPALLGGIARRLITSGESCHVIDVNEGRVVLTECASWSVVAGGPDPASWRYQCETPGPHTSTTRTVPGDQVCHCRYAVSHVEPWRGIPPLVLAGESGRLAINLESALRWETNAAAGGEVGNVVPLPVDASDPKDETETETETETDLFAPLKRVIKTLRGRLGLVETTSAAYGDNRGSAPQDDWKPRRVGPHPPESLGTLRAAVEETVLSCCGIPPGLSRAAGGESRESYRRFYTIGVQPMASLVQAELRDKLDTPDLRLDFASLAAADVHGRARAWRSLVGKDATMDEREARRLVGLDNA